MGPFCRHRVNMQRVGSVPVVNVHNNAENTRTPKEAASAMEGYRRKRVVCFGDSITRGYVGYDWVGDISERLKDKYEIIKQGTDGIVSCALLQQVPFVVVHDPDIVIVLIGTNDVLRKESNATNRWVKYYFPPLPEELSPENYRKNLSGIVRGLKKAGVDRVVLMTLPPIGDKLGDLLEESVDLHNEIIREVAGQESVHVIPLHEKLVEKLKAEVGLNGKEHTPGIPLLLSVVGSVLLHKLFGWDWDRVGEFNGYRMTADSVHLSKRSGLLLANLVEDYLTQIEK